MKKTVLAIIYLVFAIQLTANEIYHSVRVLSTGQSVFQQLHSLGIPLDHVQIKQGVFIDIIANENQGHSLANDFPANESDSFAEMEMKISK